MCENRVLRKVSDCKTEKVVEGFKKLRDRYLNEIYFSSNIFRVMK